MVLCALSCAPGSEAHTLLHTEPNGDVHDGTIADLALPRDATLLPEDARGWLAQGRVRAAIRLSDGERMNAESEEFRSVTGVPELLLSLQLDEEHGRLYTLGENALYREDVAGPCLDGPCAFPDCAPANPGNRTYFAFAPASHSSLQPPLAAHEALLDVALIPTAPGGAGGVRVLVVTSERLVILRSDASGLSLLGQCLELHDQLHGSGSPFLVSTADDHFNSLKVDRLVSARVAIDDSGRTIAYCFANVGKYAEDVHGSTPLLLLCDLDAQEDFAHPTFDADTLPATNFAYWSPYDADPLFGGSDPDGIHQNSLYAEEIRVGPGATEVYLACGRQKQLRCVTATFQPDGILPHSTITLDPAQDLAVVQLAEDSDERLFVRGSQSLFDIDISRADAVWTRLDGQPFMSGAVGHPGQVLVNDGADTARTLWTLGAGFLGYNTQAFDVGLHGPQPYWSLEYIWRCDGAVALDFDNTYVLTGGGVRHYLWTGQDWEPGRYRPTQDAHLGAQHAQGFSEELEIANLAPGAVHLLGASNTGGASGLFDWPLDAAHEPQAGSFLPLPESTVFPGWIPGDQIYTDDLAYLTAGGQSYALLCPTRQPAGAGGAREAGLALYRWNSGAWTLVASTHAALGAGFATAIALADLEPEGKVAFVASDAGVLSFALTGLAGGTPTLTLVSSIPDAATDGIVPTGSRLIVAYTLGADPRYVIYDWDRTTGAISSSGATTIPRSELGVPADYGRTFRLRFDPTSAPDGYIYDCNDGGRLFRFRYTSAGAGRLEWDALWSALDASNLQDCRIYGSGAEKRLLVTKNQETFAWVHP